MAVKDAGVGKQSLEEKTQEEGLALCQELEKLQGQVVDMRLWFSKALSNVMCSVILGRRYSESQ